MKKSYQPQDRYFQKAKDEGYVARSVFKLQEIDEHFYLIHSGNRVLDLGAAPGSFMQYTQKKIGKEGLLIGIDLKEIKIQEQKNCSTFVCDIFDDKKLAGILSAALQFDLVLSDLAPSTSGIKSLDAGRSFELSQRVLSIASRYLKKGGNLLLKFFPGAEQAELLKHAKQQFKKVTLYRPAAVRASSREQYLVGLGRL